MLKKLAIGLFVLAIGTLVITDRFTQPESTVQQTQEVAEKKKLETPIPEPSNNPTPRATDSEAAVTPEVLAEDIEATTTPTQVIVVPDPNDIDVWVNKQRELPANFEPANLVTPNVALLRNDFSLREEAAAAIEQMFVGAAAEDIDLLVYSAYRSYNTQTLAYDGYVASLGQTEADRISARPGTSEHQTGLAADIAPLSQEFALSEQFGGTKEGKWLEQNAPEYGFIIRYPQGKEDVTGYAYEPWHIRYVGVDLATTLTENGTISTLEDYFGN